MHISTIILISSLLSITLIILYFYQVGMRNIRKHEVVKHENKEEIRTTIEAAFNKDNEKSSTEEDIQIHDFLHQAILYNFDDIAIELISKSYLDIDKQNKKGETPLLLAAKSGKFKLVKGLVQQEADINKPDQNGASPLWIAAGKGYKDVVEILIRYGADINQRDFAWGMTPIMKAAQAEQIEMVYFMAQFNLDLLVRAYNGDTIIDIIRNSIAKYNAMHDPKNLELRRLMNFVAKIIRERAMFKVRMEEKKSRQN